MPMVLVAIVASAASAVATGFMVTTLGFAAGSFLVTAVGFAVSYAVSAIGAKLFGGSSSKRDAVASGQSRTETIRSNVATRRIIYGEIRTGGVLVYAASDGPDNKFMNMILVLSHGQISSVNSRFWVAEKLSTDAAFAGLISAEFKLGLESQTAVVVPGHPEWTYEHRLNGIAYARLRLEYNATAFPNGLPGPTFLVQGKPLYDPRHSLLAPAYSNNAALVILDYLRSKEGIAAPDALIDFDSFALAAAICDEDIETFDALAMSGTVKRYTINGMITLDAAPASVLDAMESACAGQLVFTGGLYRLHVGSFEYPTVTIDESWLRADPTIRINPSRAQVFNTARGTYVEPLQDWQEADFPEIVHDVQKVTDDTEVVQTLSFPLTTNSATAQRLAKIDLYRNQNASSVKLLMNWKGLDLALWQTVRVTGFAPLGGRTYRITEFVVADGGGIDATLQEESEDMFSWAAESDEELMQAAGAVPPIAPFPVVETGRASTRFDQVTERWFLDVTWGASRGWVNPISHYEVALRSNAGSWGGHFNAGGLTAALQVADDDLYTVRVRARDTSGNAGPWRYLETSNGFVPRPMPVVGLSVSQNGSVFSASWTAHAEAVDGYEVQARPADFPDWYAPARGALISATYGAPGSGAQHSISSSLTSLTVRVRAIGRAGVRGYWCEPVTASF